METKNVAIMARVEFCIFDEGPVLLRWALAIVPGILWRSFS